MGFGPSLCESSLNYCVEKFFRKLAGMADLEDSLKKLDRLTQEEARMALSEIRKIAHNIHNEFKVVDGKLEIVGDNVEVMGDKVADVGDKVEGVGDKVDNVGDKIDDVGDRVHDVRDKVHDVGNKVVDVGDKVEDFNDKVEDLGDKVHCVDEKVQVIIDGARGLSTQSLIPPKIHTSEGKQTASSIDEVKCSSFPNVISTRAYCKSGREPVETALTNLDFSVQSVHEP